jgi:hypothetical protein
VKWKRRKETDRKEGSRNSSVRLSGLAKAISSPCRACLLLVQNMTDSRADSVANAEYSVSEASWGKLLPLSKLLIEGCPRIARASACTSPTVHELALSR